MTLNRDEHQEDEKPTCFVVCPIGDRFAPPGTDSRTRYEDSIQIWEEVFLPACERCDLEPIRADKLAQPGEIPEQIFRLIRDSQVLIADVTGGNPNVMYELGLRHSVDKLTIQIGEYDRLPFDINTIRTIQFKRTPAGLIDARDRLIEAIEEGLSGRGTAVTATRVWMSASEHTALQTVTIQVDNVADQQEQEGFLDILAGGEAAAVKLESTLNDAAGALKLLGEQGTLFQEKVTSSDAQGKGFVGRLVLARDFADEISEPAQSLENCSSEFVDLVNRIDASNDYILGQIEAGEESLEDCLGYLQPIFGLAHATEGVSLTLTGFLQTGRNLRKISRDLAPVSKQIERSITRFLSGLSTIEAWGVRVEALDGWSELNRE